MNSYAKIMSFLLITVSMPAACLGVPNFSDVQNRDWNLAEIRIGPESITIDGAGEMFTLRFDMERVNGIGMPNRYFAPYTLADKQGIAINTMAQTRMAALREPEKLKEDEFFFYLQNAVRWNLVRGNLELFSRGQDGLQAVLIFVPATIGIEGN